MEDGWTATDSAWPLAGVGGRALCTGAATWRLTRSQEVGPGGYVTTLALGPAVCG